MTTQRTLGYIQNEWVCPNCHTRNKGAVKACENCGAPQPEKVQFELGADQKFITDEEQIRAAQAGADIHCGFCGTRNPATAQTCSQCGADLKEGEARESGRLMQAPPPLPKTVICKNCGSENPGANSTCSNCGSPLPRLQQAATNMAGPQNVISPAAPLTPKKSSIKVWWIAGAILACLAVVCVGAIALFVPTASVQATVTDVHWQTNVPVQEVQAVRYTNEQGSPPSDAYDVSCHTKTKQVCEQRTVDQGNGYSKVEEVCHDENTDYCSYTVDEWQTIQTYTLEGNDLHPVYDNPSISSDQRIGDKSEDLNVTFSTDKGEKTYSAGSESEFQQFTPGSTWTLKLNALGGVVSVTK